MQVHYGEGVAIGTIVASSALSSIFGGIGDAPPKGFVSDSPLEGDGFEPSVPGVARLRF